MPGQRHDADAHPGRGRPRHRAARLRGGRALAADYRWAIDIEICVFPQDGLTNYPGTEELLVAALKRGAPVLGAAPRYDSDPPAQIGRIFALAREFDVDLDMHLDVGDSPSTWTFTSSAS